MAHPIVFVPLMALGLFAAEDYSLFARIEPCVSKLHAVYKNQNRLIDYFSYSPGESELAFKGIEVGNEPVYFKVIKGDPEPRALHVRRDGKKWERSSKTDALQSARDRVTEALNHLPELFDARVKFFEKADPKNPSPVNQADFRNAMTACAKLYNGDAGAQNAVLDLRMSQAMIMHREIIEKSDRHPTGPGIGQVVESQSLKSVENRSVSGRGKPEQKSGTATQ